MPKTYVSNTFIRVQGSQLYAIFAWSQKPEQLIPVKSWLTLLEIFISERSLEAAYQIFQEIRAAAIAEKVILELSQYEKLLRNSTEIIVWLAEKKLTLFGRGFRSFIEKDMQFELGDLSCETHQVLPQLFNLQQVKLEDDLSTINTLETFEKLVEHLENLGLLSPATGSIEWGDLKRFSPICQAFGLTRGTPIDRYYLQKFITEIQGFIGGNILEVGGIPKDRDFYQLNPANSYRNLNIEAGPGVDIVGDVHDHSIVTKESVDSVVIFNVLEHCYAPWIAIENIYSWLKKGGKCFAMVPSAIRVHATPVDYWRPLPDGFAWLFRQFSKQKLYVYGNPITVIASYQGIAVEELTTEELDAFHPDYPVATCIMAEK